LGWDPEGRRQSGRLDDNVKGHVKEIGLDCISLIDLAQDSCYWKAFVNVVSKKLGEFLDLLRDY
jgi:hypothetical protein